ncbi:MAG: hypothetical protein OXJ90_27665 [Spirochaetaceae bacterium]|nr:hypothetical protein [Spirochaetaceae bacterium]
MTVPLRIGTTRQLFVEDFIVFYLDRARLYSFMQAGERAPADR